MKTLPAVLFSAAVVASACVAPDSAARLELPSVGRIESSHGYGSGIAIADGWVLTCEHVNVKAQVVRWNHPTQDMSLVYDPAVRARPVVFGSLPQFGDPLRALGWHAGKELLLTEGFAGFASDKNMTMSCPVMPGCSGGAVLNARGEIVGVISQVGTWHYPMGGYSPVPHMSYYEPIDLAWMARVIKQQREKK